MRYYKSPDACGVPTRSQFLLETGQRGKCRLCLRGRGSWSSGDWRTGQASDSSPWEVPTNIYESFLSAGWWGKLGKIMNVSTWDSPPTRCVSLTSRHLSGQLLNSLICHMRPPRGSWRPHFVLGTQQWLLKSFPYFKSKVASPSHLALERTTHPFPSEVALFPSSGTLILLWGHLPPFLTQDPKVMNFWIPMSWFFKCWWIQLTWSKSESAFGFKIKRFDYRACFCALFL